MGCLRPATPGFIVTLVATALLAVVSFCVPYFKSVFFLKASISVSGHNGTITFGTLGYCLELSNGTTCSTPSIGYQLGKRLLLLTPVCPIDFLKTSMDWLGTNYPLKFPKLLSSGSHTLYSSMSSRLQVPQFLQSLVY